MLSNANKEQLSEIAKYIDSDFGVADEFGHVLFYSAKGDENSSVKNVEAEIADIFTEMQNDETVNLYEINEFAGKGYLFQNAAAENDETMFLFAGIHPEIPYEKSGLKSLLALAAHAFRYRESQSSKDLINIFKRLIIEGRRNITEEQVESVYGEFIAKANGYVVVLVTLNLSGGAQAVDSDLICRALQEIFETEKGFLIIPVDYARTAIICPLNETNTYESVLEYANMTGDILVSEAMVDTYVSMSSVTANIMNLNEAYTEADKAKNIGMIFEMKCKCFEYIRLGVEKLIYSIPKDACMNYIRETFGESFLNDKSSRELLNTVKVYLENNLNVSEASRVLYIHRNTLMYRLEKFNKMTGLDCSKFEIGMRVGIALLILQFTENKESKESAVFNKQYIQ